MWVDAPKQVVRPPLDKFKIFNFLFLCEMFRGVMRRTNKLGNSLDWTSVSTLPLPTPPHLIVEYFRVKKLFNTHTHAPGPGLDRCGLAKLNFWAGKTSMNLENFHEP